MWYAHAYFLPYRHILRQPVPLLFAYFVWHEKNYDKRHHREAKEEDSNFLALLLAKSFLYFVLVVLP